MTASERELEQLRSHTDSLAQIEGVIDQMEVDDFPMLKGELEIIRAKIDACIFVLASVAKRD